MFLARARQLLHIVMVLWATVGLHACQREPPGAGVLQIGATAVPHEAMLRHIQPLLAEAGIALKVVVMQDYVQPNLRVASGDLDANFFQTAAYFEDFKKHHGLPLVSAGSVHMEPFALYSKKHARLEDLPRRAKVALPSDASNQHRALMLLAQAGIIALRETAVGTLVSVRDIQNNPRQLQFLPVEAAMMPRMLSDADVAGINANFALAAHLRPSIDGLAVEDAEAAPYANIVAIRKTDALRPEIAQLMAALRSETMRTFMTQTYQGSVVATF